MDIQAYLDRIAHSGSRVCNLNTLEALVRSHLLTVPFENFDIHLGVPIRLNSESLFDKIVQRERGGFCYELNSLFADLLRAMGFEVDLLAARVYRKKKLGPAFDHMALRVHLEGQAYLVDVGFGDASTGPLAMRAGETCRAIGGEVSLYDSALGLHFEHEAKNGDTKGYVLSLSSYQIEDFAPMCLHHQRSARSWFTRERICILHGEAGVQSLIEGKYKSETNCRGVEDDGEYLRILKNQFGLELAGLPANTSARFAMRWQKRALAIEERARQMGLLSRRLSASF